MKRIVLFALTNLGVLLMLGAVVRLPGVDRYLTEYGPDVPRLLVFSALVGFAGSIVSLLLSKPRAKWSTGARVIAAAAAPDVVDRAVSRTEGDRAAGPAFHVTVFVCEMLFGLLATLIVIAFSRRREFSADRRPAEYLGSPRPMIAALARLGGVDAGELPASLRAMGITSRPGWMAVFASHPPIADRIAALQGLQWAPA